MMRSEKSGVRGRERDEKFVQKRVFGDAIVNRGTGGKAQIQNDTTLTVIFGDSLQGVRFDTATGKG